MIDRTHFEWLTFGEPNFKRELLQLFEWQLEILLARMRDSAAAAALAHMLKGSASSIGAWGVVRAAHLSERAVGSSTAERGLTVDRLANAINQARSANADLLRAG